MGFWEFEVGMMIIECSRGSGIGFGGLEGEMKGNDLSEGYKLYNYI